MTPISTCCYKAGNRELEFKIATMQVETEQRTTQQRAPVNNKTTKHNTSRDLQTLCTCRLQRNAPQELEPQVHRDHHRIATMHTFGNWLKRSRSQSL